MDSTKILRITSQLQSQGYSALRIKNRLKKEELQEQQEKNQKPVKEITITINWVRSNTWGMNPHAEARIEYLDGSYGFIDGYKASGCGYDKESTVIASLLNDCIRYKLWELKLVTIDPSDKPYGIRLDYDFHPSFEGGVGTNCYYSIIKFLGGKMTNVANGKSFGVYKIEFKEEI